MHIIENCLRLYTSLDLLDETVRFYEELQETTCTRRVLITETNVVAAKVGGVLVLARDEVFPASVREVQAVFYVDQLDEAITWIAAQGAEILQAPHKVTAGRNATVRHPDGLVVEYFQAGE
jgi:predicted enzyme related to lactoylglutathione lyase